MNRKEAIEIIKNSNINGARMNGKNLFIEAINELMKDITLSDLLGWEEGVEYHCYDDRFIIMDNELYIWNYTKRDWIDAYSVSVNRFEQLRQAKKIEQKLKAYHVKDEYSYKCLMKKLEEQGYIWFSNKKPTEGFHWDTYKSNTVVFCKEGKTITYSELSYYETDEKSRYDLIEYHKEEPKYYAFVKDTRTWIRDLTGKAIKSTKSEWNKLGINDTNADFEEVE